ncbi:MAG: hypothetical protein E7180_01300 [Erysipelotrichaceae bacterium]|nr:hypothetical protein [Erysipelotrichaceae bacterium]
MARQNKTNIMLSAVMATLVMGSLVFSSYAYWSKNKAELNIPTTEFNATEEEFTFFACVPNIASSTGYDYYDLEQVPTDLVDDINGLAVVRYEALTKTAFIPEYPEVVIEGELYNDNSKKELPVIHILNSLSSDDITIQNGFTKVVNLIIPSTITYIEPGSFNGATSLSEISILGDENSGDISFSETNFTRVESLGQLRYQNDSRKTKVSLSDTSSYFRMQFENGALQYDNKKQVYSTYVIPNTTINSISLTKTVNSEETTIDASVNMVANVKYRIDYSKTNDTISVYEYEYKLLANEVETPLVLNTDVRHEEYVIDNTFGIININTLDDIYVNEYVNESLNDTNSFRLKYLDADYSSNNCNYQVKFAPSLVFESTHYYTSNSGELLNVNTQTQIGVEKAYFLNQVTNQIEEVNNQEKQIITIEDDDYLSLYVVASNSNGDKYIDPNTESEYIQMYPTDDETGYTFTFLKTLAPDNLLPTSYVFYKGKYNIVSLPEYISSSQSEEELYQEVDYIDGEQVYYFDLNGANLHSADHPSSGEENPDYKWYLAYWPSSGTMTTKPLEFVSDDSDLIRFTIPDGTTKFKFVRVPYETDIASALTGNWEDVTNQNYYDVNVTTDLINRDNNYMSFHSWNEDKFYISFANVNIENNTRRIYLDTNNAGFLGEHHTTNQSTGKLEDPLYRWYLIYWKKVNGVEKQYEMPIFYLDDNATSLVIDIPLDAEKFKFARINYGDDIKTCLANNWNGVINQNNSDITLSSLSSNNVIYFTEWDEWNAKMFKVAFKEADMDSSVNPQDKNYFIIDNYGATGNTSYLVLNENLGYNLRNATNTSKDYAYEFTKLEALHNGIIDKVSLTKGSEISSKIYNPFTNTYDTLSFSASNVSVNSELDINDYLSFSNGKVIVEEDIVIKFYLKTNYDKTSKLLKSYTLYIDITEDAIDDIERTIVRDSENTYDLEYTQENIVLSGEYPLLTSNSVVMLTRNYANDDFEEYYVYDENGFDGSYIVSQYSDTGRKYGFGQLNEYFGVYRNDSPLGEYDVSNQTIVKFTPNEGNSYKESYLGAYDEFGNLLTILDYSENQSLLGGYNVYLGSIPVSGKDYSYIDVKELGEEHTITSSTTVYVDFSNTEISGDDTGETPDFQWYVIYWANENDERTIEPIYYIKNQGTVIKFELPNEANRFKIVRIPTEHNTSKELVLDNQGNVDWDGYYLTNDWNYITNQIERDIYPAELSNFNCIRFTYWEEDVGNYKGRFRFDLTNYNTSSLSDLVTEADVSDSSSLQYEYYYSMLNNNNGFIKESIDGSDTYYTFDKAFVVQTSAYQILKANGTTVSFKNNSSPLDFSIIDGYTYTGLSFDGSNGVTFPGTGYYDLRMLVRNGSYYLGYKYQGTRLTLRDETFTIKTIVDGVETSSQLMNQTNNLNNYFQDINLTSSNTTIQILDESMVMVDTFVIDEAGYYRVYASDVGNLYWTDPHYSYIKLNYINITYDLVNNGALLFETTNQYIERARPYNDYLTSSIETIYQIESESIPAENMLLHEGIYRAYIDIGTIDEEVFVYLNEEEIASITIPYPGSYLVEFNGSTINATRIQKASTFTIVLNGEEVAELIVKEDTKAYFEYTLEEYIVIENEIDLANTDTILVVDSSGYTVSQIDSITYDEDPETEGNTKITTIPVGVYQLTYSIDSSRRANSTYQVFTYIKLVPKQSSTVTFHYTLEETMEETTVTQLIGTYYGTTLRTYEELGGYVEGGKAFIGWATSSSGAVVYQDGEKVTRTLDLYPVFRESVHDTIFVTDLIFDSTTDIKFTLSDLNDYHIESVVYSLDDGSHGTMYSRYISIDGETNIVTLKATICELIGYVEGGQEFYVTLSNGIQEYTVSVYIPYPKYSSGIIVAPNVEQYVDEVDTTNDVDVDYSTLFE